ncbi:MULTISPECIES: hypothetical protein [Streptomyces]|uniref:AAA family ATPase n=1 Tax=Streptomyces griseocarneus TaxID=51201 RepID=A0ABX7RQZ3_9ACTN|nr:MULTISPECIES: hypothetical protein [Streptomyces]QSY49645.1 hypothetical protein J3S04_00455 [Streptomyces griseocarneus]
MERQQIPGRRSLAQRRRQRAAAGHTDLSHKVKGAQVSGGHVGTLTNNFHAAAQHHHYHGPADTALPQAGRVPSERLEQLERVYVPGPYHAKALEQLLAQRYVVLRGQPGTGRSTAAARMLAEVAGTDVYRLAETTEPERIPDRESRTGGFILPVSPQGRVLTRGALETTASRLLENEQYLVLVVDHNVRLSGVEPVDWEPAPPRDVLARHLESLLGDDDYRAFGTELMQLEATRLFLASPPVPRECPTYARLLAGYRRGTVSEAELEDFDTEADRRRVASALGNPDVSLWDKAFLIALSVLGPAPYPLLIQCGDRLAEGLYAVEQPGTPVGRPVFDPDRMSRLLGMAHAYLAEPAGTRFDGAERPVVRMYDEDDRLHVLGQVWWQHPETRGPLTEWLDSLAYDGEDSPVPLSQVLPAEDALAEGAMLLGLVDFPGASDDLLTVWAMSPNESARRVAATAMNYLAEYDASADDVHDVLADWSSGPEPELCWTAVHAYSTRTDTLGARTPAEALTVVENALQAMLDQAAGTEDEGEAEDEGDEPDLLGECGDALWWIAEVGDATAIRTVTEHLHSWVFGTGEADEESEEGEENEEGEARWRRLGLTLFLRANHAADADEDTLLGVSLLALLADDRPGVPQRTRDQVRDLWTEALSAPDRADDVRELLHTWLACARAHKPSRHYLAERLLPELTADHDGSERLRLLIQETAAASGRPDDARLLTP